jgi:hypothetical protein
MHALALERTPVVARRITWMAPLGAGIFVGSLAFDALPVALEAVGPAAWTWAVGGFLLMWLSTKGKRALGVASAGVWLHSLLEGIAAGAGRTMSLGGLVLALGLLVHLIPEGAALFALQTEAGVPTRRAIARCAVTWVLVIAGFVGGVLTLGTVPVRPFGAAMGLAAGLFAYLGWLLWKRRPDSRYAWVAVALGVLWVAGIHLAS